eukprot:scaffold34409_cov112-Isochrysis_galbana.AAC.4
MSRSSKVGEKIHLFPDALMQPRRGCSVGGGWLSLSDAPFAQSGYGESGGSVFRHGHAKPLATWTLAFALPSLFATSAPHSVIQKGTRAAPPASALSPRLPAHQFRRGDWLCVPRDAGQLRWLPFVLSDSAGRH